MASPSMTCLSIDGCRRRQRRLLDEMERLQLDWVVAVRNQTICWITGAWFPPEYEPIAALRSNGEVTLLAPQSQLDEIHVMAVDDLRIYEVDWLCTR